LPDQALRRTGGTVHGDASAATGTAASLSVGSLQQSAQPTLRTRPARSHEQPWQVKSLLRTLLTLQETPASIRFAVLHAFTA
jgi:hypothetical protein